MRKRDLGRLLDLLLELSGDINDDAISDAIGLIRWKISEIYNAPAQTPHKTRGAERGEGQA